MAKPAQLCRKNEEAAPENKERQLSLI